MKHNSIFWEANNPNSNSVIYLLGTNHDESDTVLHNLRNFDSIFNSVDLYMMEITEENSKKIRDLYSYLPKDSSYKEILTPDDYTFLINKLKSEFGENIEPLLNLRQAIIQLIYTASIRQKIDTGHTSIPLDQKMDFVLQKRAQSTQKEILSLDDETTQFYTIDNIDRQIQLLWHTVRNEENLRNVKEYNSLKKHTEKFNTAYRNFDLDEIEKLNKKLFDGIPDSVFLDQVHKKSLINTGVERNKIWIKK